MLTFLHYFTENSKDIELPNNQLIPEEEIDLYVQHIQDRREEVLKFLKEQIIFIQNQKHFKADSVKFLVNRYNNVLSKSNIEH
jgi:hypothetical protein